MSLVLTPVGVLYPNAFVGLGDLAPTYVITTQALAATGDKLAYIGRLFIEGEAASLTAYYHRDTDTTATAITLATMTVGTFTSSGFKEIDATNMPGWYQFCPPNAAIASGAKSCAFHLKGATNMAPLPIEVQLTSYDPDNATSLGLSRLDAAISSRMATYTQPTGFLNVTFPTGTLPLATDIVSGGALTTSGGIGSADAKKMNGVPVKGTGVAGDLWRG